MEASGPCEILVFICVIVHQGCIHFPKILDPNQNYRCHETSFMRRTQI